MFEYKAKVVKVIDGDTVDLDVDLGFLIHCNPLRVRLLGINTPEKNSKNPAERVAALEATKALEGLLKGELTVKTQKDEQEKYGRYLATIINSTGVDVNAEMVKLGHAMIYNGVGARPPWPWR